LGDDRVDDLPRRAVTLDRPFDAPRAQLDVRGRRCAFGLLEGLNRSSPGSGARTGSSRPLAPVNRVNVTGWGDGHTTGQYAVESARRSRLPAANAWAMWLSATRTPYRRPGSIASGCSWLARCVRLSTP